MTPDIEEFPAHIKSREERFAYTCEIHASWFQFLAQKNLIARLSIEAQDVVQDAFLESWTALHGYREEGSMRAWISTFVVWIAWARNRKSDPLFRPRNLLTENIPLRPLSDRANGFATRLEVNDILSRILPMLSEAQQEFLTQWSQGAYVGLMSDNVHRGKLVRIKRRMRSIAKRKKISL